MAVDLHIHSIYSDGTFTPTKICETAKKLGLTCISITDHDNVSGVAEGVKAAEEIGLKLIPGIELTSIENGKELHILGYFIDYNNKKLREHLDDGLARNRERIKEMIKKLNQIGFEISNDEVISLAHGGNPGRPHIARVLVAHKYVETTQAAFDKYIGSNCPCYVEMEGKSNRDCYEMILEAGGIPSIAHPGYLGRAEMMNENEIMQHRDMGALAIEVFHTKHDNYMVNAYLKMAKQFEMGITGGSDCHGDFYSKLLMEKCQVPDWVGENLIKFREKLIK